jgi:hypothetical protein
MNMKVHQTLVWLNLLSFRTYDLAAPTIGIKSGLSRVGYRTSGCVQVLVSGAEDLAMTACSTFPYTISCKSLHLLQTFTNNRLDRYAILSLTHKHALFPAQL